jgi:hypothetical protein
MIKQLRSFDELKIKIKGGLDVLGINFELGLLKSKLSKFKLFRTNNQVSMKSRS